MSMTIGVRCIGASDDLVRSMIVGLGEHNATWYRQHPLAPSPRDAGVRYRPDRASDSIMLVDAELLLRDLVGSCGSVAAAFYGWAKATGGYPVVLAPRREAGLWHAVVTVRGLLWDPAKELRAYG